MKRYVLGFVVWEILLGGGGSPLSAILVSVTQPTKSIETFGVDQGCL